MRDWQPAIVVNAHKGKVELCPDRIALIGKRVMARIYDDRIADQWYSFCSSKRSFQVQGHPDLWFCEHEILTD